jgi:succinoglycan biosynthesis transport protein ExoP
MSPAASTPEDKIEDAPVDLRTVLGRLARRWKLFAAIPPLCLVATFAIFRSIPVAYQSEVQLLIFDPQGQMEVANGQPQESARDFDTATINTEIQVIKSTALLRRVAQKLRLDEYPEFERRGGVNGPLDRLGLSRIVNGLQRLVEPPNAAEPHSTAHLKTARNPAKAAAERIDTATKILGERLRVDPVPFSYVFVVSVTLHSPELAQLVAAKVVDEYLVDQREARQSALQQTALWLKARLSDLKSRVVESETAMEKLKAQSGLSDTGKGSVNEQQITDLNAQLMVARAEVAEKRAQLQQAQQASASNGALEGVAEGVSSPLMSQLRLQESELERRAAMLQSKLGERHAEVLAADAQLAGINKAMRDEAGHILADLQNGFDIAERREQSLETSLQRLTAAQGESGDYVKLQQLHRVAEADSKLYETYLSQYNEINTRASLQIVGARIISPAGLPAAPSFPRHILLFYLGAGGLGLVIAAMTALLAEYFWPTVASGVDAEQMFGVPVLGALPVAPQRGPGRGNERENMVQTVVRTPLSPFSEAVRTIRVGLRLSGWHDGPMVILVTSCLPGEGKSALAMLLAASAAGAHQRSLLVDCDLRGRTVSQYFGEHGPGLAELLAGSADLAGATIRDAATGCFVMPAGISRDGPGDLLSSSRMGEIISRVKSDFDYVVLDSPPLLSVVDALALAMIADKILLTIDSTHARYDDIAEAFRLLGPQTARVAGMVFNKVSRRQLGRYRYGGYYYGEAVAAGGER